RPSRRASLRPARPGAGSAITLVHRDARDGRGARGSARNEPLTSPRRTTPPTSTETPPAARARRPTPRHTAMANVDVSVIIPTFHRERELVEAIDSALSQQGVEVEVIVLDDSPEASARSVAAAIDDPRVRYVARATPSGGRP